MFLLPVLLSIACFLWGCRMSLRPGSVWWAGVGPWGLAIAFFLLALAWRADVARSEALEAQRGARIEFDTPR